jgi:hypothetical protein
MTWHYCDKELTDAVINGTYNKNLDNAYLVWAKGRCLGNPEFDNNFVTDKDSVLTLYL